MIASNAAVQSAFRVDDSLQGWNISAKEWLMKHHKANDIDGLATAIAVFDTRGRLLIVQRAAHDSMPNRWELPGGAVDDDDPTILHGAARELFEEAGLLAQSFTHVIPAGPQVAPGNVFTNSTKTKRWCQFAFHATVEGLRVQLDPNEHQAFFWAMEDEIRAQQSAEQDLPITKEAVLAIMIEAFRLRRTGMKA
ncbi:hypothetical protein AMS68_007975 [Peltaster fructicola]|uniref:Nudix hydrolase domain-containing protein n=1 Tax=Peltaster fructicola TaxID=286661 RepID=A0A6H0Y6H5_9PEZI|nr:hypothetical protein AMS68_007975 [Peltaster fructicola]